VPVSGRCNRAVRSTSSGSNTLRKDGTTGGWVEKPNYFDIVVWGAHGENCARYPTKGRGIAVDGRLEWREWAGEGGAKRQAVEIVADTVEFLAIPGVTVDRPGPTQTSRPMNGDIPF
jgi:single-strand DNA-binding protein